MTKEKREKMFRDEDAKGKLKNMNLMDDVFFSLVMQNEEFCKKVLSITLGKEMVHIEYMHVQETFQNSPGYKSIRLDMYAKDIEGTVYIIEVQKLATGQHIPKRSRYYQGLVDTSSLLTGNKIKYSDLPKQYIVFITDKDLFGKGLYQYQFTNKCNEDTNLELGDETYKIFLNTGGNISNGVDETLIQFLKYVNNTTGDIAYGNEKLMEIHAFVENLKSSKELEESYMNMRAYAYEASEEARKEGLEEGRKEGHEENQKKIIFNLLKKGMTMEEIADIVNVPISEISKISEWK